MIQAKKHKKEAERLKALESYSILDTVSDSDFDNLTAIAAEICGTPISLVTLIDDKRQWFKSHHGLSVEETPREFAFCAHAINDQENVFIVQDARTDDRFHDNPIVTGDPYVIFYAGVPLISNNGYPVGTLCVIDHKPKLLSKSQIKSLRALASQVMNLLNLKKTKLSLDKTLTKLEEKNEELERFATVAAHDLKSPLIGIKGVARLLSESHSTQLDEEGKEMIGLIEESSGTLIKFIDGLLEYSKCENVLKEKKSHINLNELIKSIKGLFNYDYNFILNLNTSISNLVTNRTALEQILINLVTNAIKYNDKEHTEIEIGVSSTDTHYEFYVKDNGPGIAVKNHEKIFGIFETISNKDKFGQAGNGIGLASVKKIVEHSGGSIKVESKLTKGAKFIFTIEK